MAYGSFRVFHQCTKKTRGQSSGRQAFMCKLRDQRRENFNNNLRHQAPAQTVWIFYTSDDTSRLDFRRPPGPVCDPPRGAHFPEQRLVIEPTTRLNS